MKKMLSILIAVILFYPSMAIVPNYTLEKSLNANTIMIPIGKTGDKISLAAFSKLTPAAYEKLAHVKLGFFDRIAYKKAMRKLNKSIELDGTITNKKVALLVKPIDDPLNGFNLGGFALGLLIGLLGVLIAYLINDSNKSSRIKWAWIGFAVWIALILVFAVL